MAKEELITFEGLVTEILTDARYRVQLDAGHEIVAYTAGKMKKNRIKTLAGDRVTVEMSPYDLEKGRLIFRHKDSGASSGPRPPLSSIGRSIRTTGRIRTVPMPSRGAPSRAGRREAASAGNSMMVPMFRSLSLPRGRDLAGDMRSFRTERG